MKSYSLARGTFTYNHTVAVNSLNCHRCDILPTNAIVEIGRYISIDLHMDYLINSRALTTDTTNYNQMTS